jgi:NitT/TauT family transport system ATP-binding protein
MGVVVLASRGSCKCRSRHRVSGGSSLSPSGHGSPRRSSGNNRSGWNGERHGLPISSARGLSLECELVDVPARLTVTELSVSLPTDGGSTLVLEGVSLTCAPGQLLGLVGRSGVGKTTLLRAIAGLIPSTPQDAVRVDGIAIDSPGADRPMVFQDHAVFPWMSAIDNVAYPLRVQGQSRPAARGRARDLLGELGLADAADRMSHELSGGMRQRVAIARALAAQARVLLLDEPFSALDSATRLEVRVALDRVVERNALAVVLVTHDLREVIDSCDRVAVLSGRPAKKVLEVDIQASKGASPDALLSQLVNAML